MCNRVLVNMVVMEMGSGLHMSNVHLECCMYILFILSVYLCTDGMMS